jgi:hypothetical protein
MAHRENSVFPNKATLFESKYHWVRIKSDPHATAEPAEVDYEDGRAVRVWFTGMETPFPADECEIYEEIVRNQGSQHGLSQN